MLVPRADCEGTSDKTDIEISGEFIHELLHGHFAELLLSNYNGGIPPDLFLPNPDTSPDAPPFIINTDYFLELVNAYNSRMDPPSGNQHVLFFTHLMDMVANALVEIAVQEPRKIICIMHQKTLIFLTKINILQWYTY